MRFHLLVAFVLISLPGYAVTIYFPQIANGDGYQTTITISNPGDNAGTGTLRFFTPSGTPWSLSVLNLAVASEFPVVIPAHGSIRFSTSGTGSIATGWASLESVEVLSGVANFEIREQGMLVQTLGVLGAPAAKRLMIPVDYNSLANVGLALINTSGTSSLTVDLSLVNEAGVIVLNSTDPSYQNIPAHGYVTKFAHETFPNIPMDFKGSLVGEVNGNGAMAVLGLTQREGLYSAIPVANPSLAVAKRMLGEWQLYIDTPWWWDIAFSLRGIEENRNNPGQFQAWGFDYEWYTALWVYWDNTRQSYVGIAQWPGDNGSDIYIFNFTSDTSISGSYYWQEPFYSDPMSHPLGTRYDLTGTRTDR